MTNKDPATLRLRILLNTLAEHAGATFCAAFMPRELGLGLVAHSDVNQLSIDVVNNVWFRQETQLRNGTMVSFGSSLVWPLFDGPKFLGVVFLDNAQPQLAEVDDARQCVVEIAARLRRTKPPTLFNNYLAIGLSLADARREAERDHLIAAVRLAGGKIRAAARLLRVTRETVYKRADRLEVDLDALRTRG